MADYGDKGKRKKKRTIKPRMTDKEITSLAPGKTMVILAKPSSEKSIEPSSSVSSQSGSGSSEKSQPSELHQKSQPTMILKSREFDSSAKGSPPIHNDDVKGSRGISPPTTVSSSIASSPTPSYSNNPTKHTIVVNEANVESKLNGHVHMKMAKKLIDDGMQWVENGLEFLLDQTDFYVIGVIGMQGAGKSTIMSLLANGGFDISDRKHIFRTQMRECREVGEHATDGIDFFVTTDRIILLDMQPILSGSVLEKLLESDKRYTSDFGSIVQTAEMQSLQFAAFMLTVCHTVILVQDWFTDPNVLRLIQTAEMLKPSIPSQSSMDSTMDDNEDDYFPHIVFVQNKCVPLEFSADRIKTMQEILSSIFYKSKLKYKGSVGMENDNLIPKLNSLDSSDMNLFLFPEKSNKPQLSSKDLPDYIGYPSMERFSESFYQQIYSMPRSNLTRVPLTEKNWFHYAARTWEGIKKSNLFIEYSRVLP